MAEEKDEKTESAAVAVDKDIDELFTFTCTSDYATAANDPAIVNLKLVACVDSGASHDYCPEHLKFANYRSINRDIMAANGKSIKAVGMGDIYLDLPNGTKQTKTLFKNAIQAPSMAFTLISTSRLDLANCLITFYKGMCTIKDAKGCTITTIPCADRLYSAIMTKAENKWEHANIVSENMTISQAHRKLGHVAHTALEHAITQGYITGIKINSTSKPKFCEPCAKAKLARQPFPQESQTRATVTGVTSLHSRLVLGRDSNKELSSIQAGSTSRGCEQSIVD